VRPFAFPEEPIMIDLHAILCGLIRPTEPQATMLRVLRERFQGKLLSKRVLDALKEATGDDTITDRRQYGMTHLEWGNYHWAKDNDPRPKGSLLLAHTVKSVYIDADDIVKRNPCYFEDAAENNAQIEDLLQHSDVIRDLERQIESYHALKVQLDELKGRILLRTAHGGTFGVLRYEIDKILDGEKPNGRS
jgi:hypothetical protein